MILQMKTKDLKKWIKVPKKVMMVSKWLRIRKMGNHCRIKIANDLIKVNKTKKKAIMTRQYRYLNLSSEFSRKKERW